MTVDEELSLDAFADLAKAMGLSIVPDELATTREGYLGLCRILALLPRDLDAFEEPAIVFSPGEDARR
ncbi:hypothetical protein ACWIGM_07370 [Bosea sp. NPDC055332]